MDYIQNDTRNQIFRFTEIIDLINKADERRQLTFEDQGYVDDIDLFLKGCISSLPITAVLDGSSVDWRLLQGQKKIKTMLDFYNGLIKRQGKLYSQLEGYERHNFKWIKIYTVVVNPSYSDKELVDFLKI